MIVELGHFSLILALTLVVAQAVLAYLTISVPRYRQWMRLPESLAAGSFLFVLLAFCALTNAFLNDDFSVQYVAEHSNSRLPEVFKFSAVWGGHEGSFLLWTLVSAGWTLAVAVFSGQLTEDMKVRVLGVLGFLNAGFLIFLIFASNPFERMLPVYPEDGGDLNPLLQDFGLIVHPPMLYMGYVGFAVPFAFAIATLWAGRLDAAWARWSRPWTNAAWAFLTLGITLGSYWAYYELGWGGWWFWDAVENASFMPWLVGTALIHSLAATEKRGVFRSWTVLLAIFAFSFSLLGAFLVRSGVLTSVHTFAVDPERGLFILAFLVVVIGGSLALYAMRAADVRSTAQFSLSGREAMLLANNVILVVTTAAVLAGTLAPLIYESLFAGDKLSVGPPWFNTVFVPLVTLLFLFMVLSPYSRWRSTDASRIVVPAIQSLCAAAVVSILLFWLASGSFEVVAWFYVTLALWIVLALILDMYQNTRNKRQRLSALFGQNWSYYGMWMGHSGMAVCILGVAATLYYSDERDVRMQPDDIVVLSDYEFRFLGVDQVEGPNYLADRGLIEVRQDDELIARMYPEKRRYLSSGNVMTEAAMKPRLFVDLYVALGEPVGDDAWAVRVHYKPFVRWIWIGGAMIGLGGFITLLDRRYRRREPSRMSVTDEAPA
ncbi:MAG: heme lyase NrfEFG subunit NrfE [Gammaproteobacteria bacterium]|uniref:Heme lyase NrfEFG subunit NrfE n=1 Tax=OM182 bacterium MED-G24 TaxID=1986255 RepID=A0A2A5WVT2_9GAMM|nr:heme lyase NrfEFG subunit NrfE [Gammaproteobacteria bacterium]PDH40599.1 MAG: heme lyase NrfEFG subunit NrfE [OM182 bacterium MED-G24]RPG26046.1 MAG: heme lyase CcmF/NrfE family subunit [Gammaproteobacteria bacterium TMED50]|tara:strand:- start:17481 stop:19457 length:1977 start_codon:yes stop_codon:yes gene_type:complete